MTEAELEDDPRRMDLDDVVAVLAILDGIAVDAETVRQDPADPAHGWVLRLHWLQRGPVAADTEAALPAAFDRICCHFLTRGQLPPSSMELRGPEDDRLLVFPGGDRPSPGPHGS